MCVTYLLRSCEHLFALFGRLIDFFNTIQFSYTRSIAKKCQKVKTTRRILGVMCLTRLEKSYPQGHVYNLCDPYHKNTFPTRPRNTLKCQWSVLDLQYKENQERFLIRKEFTMNSLHENRNSLESYSQIRERLADSICDECEYACFVHKENCSRKVVK